MDLSGIISISGKGGLFKIVSQSINGIIVEPLDGGRRFPVHGAQRVSSLEDISIYTYEEDMLLSEVFKKIYELQDGKTAISHKSKPEELKKFFQKALPNYDEDRVYNSDIKKVIQWYNLLLEKGYLEATSEEDKSGDGDDNGNGDKAKKKIEKSARNESNSPVEGYGKVKDPKQKKGGGKSSKSKASNASKPKSQGRSKKG